MEPHRVLGRQPGKMRLKSCLLCERAAGVHGPPLGIGEEPRESSRAGIKERRTPGDIQVGVCSRPSEQEEQGAEASTDRSSFMFTGPGSSGGIEQLYYLQEGRPGRISPSSTTLRGIQVWTLTPTETKDIPGYDICNAMCSSPSPGAARS